MTEQERWGSGAAYESYVGRWSRLVAGRFIDWLDPTPGARWVDVGCGTGALTETILEKARPASVHGVDPSWEHVSFARARISDSRAKFAVADAQHISGEESVYNFTVSGLVLNFVPHPAAALVEMKRVTRARGWIAAYVWDYSDGMEMMRYYWDAAKELDPRARSLDEGTRFAVCRPEPLLSLWGEAALHEVTVAPIEIDTVFRDFRDYWAPFLGGQGPAPTYNMSLGESSREALETLLRRRLPVRDDGSIHLRARAWGIRGRT
jgi:trans-aconitate methyltransferase